VVSLLVERERFVIEKLEKRLQVDIPEARAAGGEFRLQSCSDLVDTDEDSSQTL
jgi:hypothetical protein